MSFIIILFVGFVVGYYSRPQPDTIVKTEVKTDTLRITQPLEVRVDTFMREVKVSVTRLDTLCITDTLHITDSILVYLPFERKVYEDSTYRAVVSGYKPILEEIDVYARETTIYKDKTSPLLSPYVSGTIGLNGDVSLGGGVFLKDRDAFGVEYGGRGLKFKYIHKF